MKHRNQQHRFIIIGFVRRRPNENDYDTKNNIVCYFVTNIISSIRVLPTSEYELSSIWLHFISFSFSFQDPPNIPAEAPELPEVEIVSESRPPIHSNPMGPGPGAYVPMSPMHPHNPNMPMSMQPGMADLSGKQPGTLMGVPQGRGTPDRKTRAQQPGPAPAQPKRTPRMQRGTTVRPSVMPPQPAPPPTVYPTPGQPAHPMYAQSNYNPWMAQQGMPAPSQQQQPQQQQQQPQPQQPMMPGYQNPQQMKQAQPVPQHVMSGVRLPGGPVRAGVPYPNQSMQQQPSLQQSQPQQQPPPGQMSAGYVNDPSVMMMSSNNVNSMNNNRQTVVPPSTSVKRKYAETTMLPGDQSAYNTPAKMTLQTNGRIRTV